MAKEKTEKQGKAGVSLLPGVLYGASIERISEADRVLKGRRWALSMYLSGLAVECVLQAIAIRNGAAHDARHDLIEWLKKCPESLKTTISVRVADDWSTVNTIWNNRLRYLSEAGVLGYLRHGDLHRRIRGGPESVLRVNATRLLISAQAVHKKGMVIWRRS